jgi:hypothetical protein
MLCCLGLFLSLSATTSDVSGVPSALAGAKAGHVDRGANAPAPVPDRRYPLTPAEELQETDKGPVNANLLTMLLLAITSFGASLLWLLTTNARRRGAICSWGVEDRAWLAVAHEGPSFLGVFQV